MFVQTIAEGGVSYHVFLVPTYVDNPLPVSCNLELFCSQCTLMLLFEIFKKIVSLHRQGTPLGDYFFGTPLKTVTTEVWRDNDHISQ